MEEINMVIQALDAGGTLAILVILVVLFYRGDLVTKKTVDKIVAVYEKQAEKMMEFHKERYGVLLEQNEKLFKQINKYLDK